jgi:hypothetical protein
MTNFLSRNYIGPVGVVQRLTAEQLLSHVLPPLAGRPQPGLIVRVQRREFDSLGNASS